MADQNPLVQNLEAINALTIREVEFLAELPKLAQEAKRYAGIVREAYTFEVGEERKLILRAGHEAEYLTSAGIWHMHYDRDEADVGCTPEAIFRMLKANFLVEKGIVDRDNNDLMSVFELHIQRRARIAAYFIGFLKRTERELQTKNKSVMREEDFI